MPDPQHAIRIGTLVPAQSSIGAAAYIRQILPYGFESFQLTFGRTLGDVNLERLAGEVHEALEGSGAVISALGLYGNPLEQGPENEQTRHDWARLIENAHHFGTRIIGGFTGRLRDRPIPESIPRFQEVFTPLAQQAAEAGVRIAFENCAMDGTWACGDWNIAHNPDAWTLMFEAVPNEVLGLEWEPCHQMVTLIDPMPQLRQWAKRIYHIHGKCCTVHWDVVKAHGIFGKRPFAYHRTPGFGDCNWTDIISDLRMAGFEGAIDIEGWHDPVYRDDLEMTGQVHSLHYLKRCRGGTYAPNPM